MKKLLIMAVITSLLPGYSTYAKESYLVYSPQNIAIFQVRFFDVGDGPFMGEKADPYESTWDLNRQQKGEIHGCHVLLGRSHCPPSLVSACRHQCRNVQVLATWGP